ncbi:hypothetical protein RRG08_046642 [Elysia crispata]|uniref:Uncharacterized protein n=1 Tax=Elysia crispata TaxID=231223 RepID=A0AAE1AR37_9GAST|nr:hypothetical protein RRG08_046642 [Elysia crispata]
MSTSKDLDLILFQYTAQEADQKLYSLSKARLLAFCYSFKLRAAISLLLNADPESIFYDFIESKRALGAALGNNSVTIIGTSEQVCFKSVYEVHSPPETSEQS